MKTLGPARVVGTPWGPWLGFCLEGDPAYRRELGWGWGARRLPVAWAPCPSLCSAQAPPWGTFGHSGQDTTWPGAGLRAPEKPESLGVG